MDAYTRAQICMYVIIDNIIHMELTLDMQLLTSELAALQNAV